MNTVHPLVAIALRAFTPYDWMMASTNWNDFTCMKLTWVNNKYMWQCHVIRQSNG